MRRFHSILFVWLLVGIVASLATAVLRHQVESRNRGVELIVDYAQVRSLAVASGQTAPETLTALKDAGVGAIAVSEQTAADLVGLGAARIGQEWNAKTGRVTTRVRFADPATLNRVLANLRARCAHLDAGDAEAWTVLSAPGLEARLAQRWEDIRGLGVGLAPEEVARVVGAGLGLVGRVGNFPGARDGSIDWILGQLAQAGVSRVIFNGDDVLGHRARVEQTARSLQAHKLTYGSIELGKQHGDEELAKALDARILRVHSIRAEEMARLNPTVAIERFVRGARERNIRIAYLRLFTSVSESPLDQNLDFIRGVAGELRDRGFELGAVATFGPVMSDAQLATALPAAASLLVVAGGVILLACILPLSMGRQLLLALVGGVLAAGLAAVSENFGRTLLAFAGAVLFPTLAFALIPAFPHPLAPSRPRALAPSLQRFAAISGVSLLGALSVVGLLSSDEALVKVSDFAGIKLAHLLPLLAIAGIYVADLLTPSVDWPAHRDRVGRRLTLFMAEPLRIWHACAGMAAVVALAVIVLRTGNDPGMGVSALELRARSLLDQLLVRPRTKEFLLGHPLLLVGLWLMATPSGVRWATPFLIVGALGQVSMVNSFCHLHTPLALTLARTWNGLWLGALIGCALCLALAARLSRRDARGAAGDAVQPGAGAQPAERRAASVER